MNGSKIDSQPILFVFVGDLMLTTKIENVANYLGYRVVLIGSESALPSDGKFVPDNQAAEPVFGPEAVLLEKITAQQPQLLIFDLGNESIPWRKWMATLKSSPATRRIPILCFGPHLDVDALGDAKKVGADGVVARSRFMSALPDLIQKYALVDKREAIQAACGGQPSELAQKGLAEFNKGDYYASHEHLEDAWNEDESEAKELYRAILQVAVAYLQIERKNYSGAVKMFLRARQWLDPLPDVCRGIDIGRLRLDAQGVYEALVALGPNKIEQFDRDLFRPIQYSLENY